MSVCGKCPLRGDGSGSERACYPILGRVGMLWEKFARGEYSRVSVDQFKGYPVRWGAYGDPAMLPASLVHAVNAQASSWTGYTHQWGKSWAQWARGVFMASCDSWSQEQAARGKGWGTFRVGTSDGADQRDSTLCPHAADASVQCVTCGKCDGREVSIYIAAHGFGSKWVPAERKRRRLALLA